jgi:hypothetical protein
MASNGAPKRRLRPLARSLIASPTLPDLRADSTVLVRMLISRCRPRRTEASSPLGCWDMSCRQEVRADAKSPSGGIIRSVMFGNMADGVEAKARRS